MSKYHSTKTVIDGITFDSKKEADRYAELKLLQKAGQISELILQPEYTLQPQFVRDGKKIQPIKYRGDFAYIEGDKVVVEDVKGFKTKEYAIKRKMFLYQYPMIDFREV